MILRWTRLARRDRDNIYNYVVAADPSAAQLLDDRIGQRSLALVDFPLAGRPGRIDGTRELTINGTRYIFVYRIVDETVWILRVFHTARAWPPSPD